ncbi:MAG TPA: type II secretion system protein GspC [Kofleriaceae bacterium]
MKRYFWVIGVLAIIVCATFAAKAAGHVVEGVFLGDPKGGPKIVPNAVSSTSTTPAKPTKDKASTQLVSRNMFCSGCTPAVATTTTTTTDPSGITLTTLPLQLLATNIGATDKDSYATIVNTENQRQGSYSVDDPLPIPGAGKLKVIKYKYVDFDNGGHLERLGLMGAAPPPTTVAAVTPDPPADGETDYSAGIQKVDDTNFVLDRKMVDEVVANPMAIAKGARVVPSAKGFKLYAIRPSSVFAKLGLSNGDTLASINNIDLTSVDKALEAFNKLREASSLELEVTRRGKPVTLKYQIK